MLRKRSFYFLILLLGLWFSFDLIAWVRTESLWFEEVGYLTTFLIQVKTRIILWALGLLVSGGYLLGNLWLANRWHRQFVQPNDKTISLKYLLPATITLSLLCCLIFFYCFFVGLNYWHSEYKHNITYFSIFPRFRLQSLRETIEEIITNYWFLGATFAGLLGIILWPDILWGMATILTLIFSLIIASNWSEFLLFSNPVLFNNPDPVFGQDISFYIFRLPGWEILEFWFTGLAFFALFSVSLIYLLAKNSLSDGYFHGFSVDQQKHLYGLTSIAFLTVAMTYWLRRYELLYSPNGAIYGAGFTQINVELPTGTLLSVLAVLMAIYFGVKTLTLKKISQVLVRRNQPKSAPPLYPKKLIYGLLIYTILSALGLLIVPSIIQKSIVQPNELNRELTYIKNSIKNTRDAFDLNNIENLSFIPEGQLTLADLNNNSQTIKNIRLWDARPLLETNRQLQQIRLYYKFPNADIDRYKLKIDPLNTEKQQVIVAARELDYTALPEKANTWLNKHLVYTHGYGFTMSPVNTVGTGGLPNYFVKDIGEGEQTLRTSNPEIRASIPIGDPRIYYGEITDNYILAPTKVKELDYPSGEKNIYNTYEGKGGIRVNNLWRKALFANYFKDWQMLLTDRLTPQTKLLFRRQIERRVQAIAPFLTYDNDPYLVIADIDKNKEEKKENYLYWMIDAYTTSNHYPYSDPGKHPFNYIRNSVKVVIDAYNGNLKFYVADNKDPIIQSWQKAFPGMFQPLSEMPAILREHLRYPNDLFEIQSDRLLIFHATNPQVFYNRDDQWQVPSEIYGEDVKPVEPYYLIMKLPTANKEEFILLYPFTPTKRTNLIAWLAGRSDGSQYGKLLLYQFPKQKLVFGPEQIEARINQDPAISQQISLWNRQGSKAIQGNLLVIPIEQSLLYVEPLYLEATQNSLPTLVRVIVAYEDNIVMAETLEQAFDALFKGNKTTAPVILSPGNNQTPLP